MKIFTENIDPSTLSKLYDINKSGLYEHIRVMPDVHEGSSIVGFTGYFKYSLSPDVIGPDIGCGMLCLNLGKIEIDPEKLDRVIHRYVPDGKAVNGINDKYYRDVNIRLDDLNCSGNLTRIPELERAIGSLGGGNHFIELDRDDENNIYLVIHTGSRNLGKQIWSIYRTQGIGQQHMLTLDKVGKYLDDVVFAQRWARLNRLIIAEKILAGLKLRKVKNYKFFDCPHNFIEGNLVRKGACKAIGDVIIPMNMRDGSLICLGKENEDWNYSAPHGAGRILSRAQARKQLSMEQYKQEMEGIYSTSVNENTIDESPMAYKPMQEIIDNIQDSVEIIKIIKPIYNFKSSGEDN